MVSYLEVEKMDSPLEPDVLLLFKLVDEFSDFLSVWSFDWKSSFSILPKRLSLCFIYDALVGLYYYKSSIGASTLDKLAKFFVVLLIFSDRLSSEDATKSVSKPPFVFGTFVGSKYISSASLFKDAESALILSIIELWFIMNNSGCETGSCNYGV